MLTFVKLGGSLITNKRVNREFRADTMRRLAVEIASVPDTTLLIGHGSGSFGHFEAKTHGTIHGVTSPAQWQGFARVSTVAAELNHYVASTLVAEGLSVMSFQPSATAIADDGVIQHMDIEPMERALEHGLIPLVYGDVAFDKRRGGTIISTETIFTYLASRLRVARILLVGEVAGVYDQTGAIIPEITGANFPQVRSALGDSGGVDVTGGMVTKVQDMLALVDQVPNLSIHIIDGSKPGELARHLSGQAENGTRIYRGR